MKNNCPVCKSPLTQERYERALGIMEAKQAALNRAKAIYEQKMVKAAQKLRKAKAEAKDARQAGMLAERARSNRLMAGQAKKIQKLQERVQQLEKGTTPQTDGLEFEDKLAARLKKEFPGDKIQHFGKGGDILHTVYSDKEQAGIIIYELKRTPSILPQHIQQTMTAKKHRQAEFAILVTTGKKQRFNGLAHEQGILIVSPLGVIPLVGLLRGHLIEMLRTKIGKNQKAVIANKLLQFVDSPLFKNPIEEIIRHGHELQGMIKSEAKEHWRMWQKRWNVYQALTWDANHVKANIQCVLHGQEPNKMERLTIPPLLLPLNESTKQ